MTNSDDASPPDPVPPAEESAAPEASQQPAVESSAPTAGAPPFRNSGADKQSPEGLPEEFELTPELVEEEAQRGDFVMRWAVVLVALLLGCTELYESAALVHVRSGEAIASAGGWAPGADALSYTTAESEWKNTSWLFDVLAAGIHSLVGFVGLSFAKAILAAVAFGLVVHINREHVSTWWASVMAALALLACYAQINAEPQAFTFVGLALTLFLLHLWREDSSPNAVWWLAPVFLIWGNLDPRVFLGLVVLIAYSVGELLCLVLKRCSHLEPPRLKKLGLVTLACLGASLVNPYHVHVLLSPLVLYGDIYPALQEFSGPLVTVESQRWYSLLDSEIWEMRTHHTLAALVVIAFSILGLILNFKNLSLGDLFVVVALVPLAVFSWHQLAPVALVCAVVGSLNAQQWYQDRFRQTYSTDKGELLFSRGGRAVTVLSLFVVGFLSISGRLNGPNGRRTGVGLEPGLASIAAAYEAEVRDIPGDGKLKAGSNLMHDTLRQGDLLIWAGRESFVDSRARLFAPGDPSLYERHLRIRQSFGASTTEERVDPKVWQEAFDEYKVTRYLPAIEEPFARYGTYFGLFRAPDWLLLHQDTLAVFQRASVLSDDEGRALAPNFVSFVENAFQEAEPLEDVARIDFARPLSFWETALDKPDVYTPASAIAARHLEVFTGNFQSVPVEQLGEIIGMHHVAIRKCLAALAEEPRSAGAHQILAQAYSALFRFERAVAQQQRARYSGSMRKTELMMALEQAAALAPESYETRVGLAQHYQDLGHLELMLRELKAVRDILSDRDEDQDEDAQKQIKTINTNIEQIEQALEKTDARINDELTKDDNAFKLAQTLQKEGFVKRALGLVEQIEEEKQSIDVVLTKIELLIANGRFQDAVDELTKLEPAVDRIAEQMQRTDVAIFVRTRLATLRLGLGQHEQSIALLEQQAATLHQSLLKNLSSLPTSGGWPTPAHMIFQAGMAQAGQAYEEAVADLYFAAGRIALESGDLERAEESLGKALEYGPNASLRPLITFYQQFLIGEAIDPVQPKLRDFDRERRARPVRAPRPQPREETSESVEE